MDLGKILSGVENSTELISKIEAEIGKEYVPRSEFNEKNAKLKAAEAELSHLQTNLANLGDEKTTWEVQVNALNEQIKGYEMAALRTKVAHETGLPYEFATRLKGDDEKALKADAESLAGFIKQVIPAQPLRSTEDSQGINSEASAYKTLLENMRLGD